MPPGTTPWRRARAAALLVALVFAISCDRAQPGASFDVVRDTLPNGAIAIHYSGLPDSTTVPLGYDLKLGMVEGDPNEIFGDIRAVEVDRDGNIYILDYQTSEVRVFYANGSYLRTLTRNGRGPSELVAANGMILTPGDTLWIQDHGQWRLLAIDLEGRELTQMPMPVRSYGYIWDGAIDERGRHWSHASHSDAPRVFPPELGLNEGSGRAYLVWYDPATDARDSTLVGERTYQSYVSRNDQGGHTYRQIPMSPNPMVLVDPSGGFWTTTGAGYSLTYRGEGGDTLLTVDVAIIPDSVTSADRRSFIDGVLRSSPDDVRVAEEIAALMPAVKPAVDHILLDDEGRLWVRRRLDEDRVTRYDVFSREGEFLDVVLLDFLPAQYFPPRIRDGRLYTIVRDEFDVQSVVRTEPLQIGRAAPR